MFMLALTIIILLVFGAGILRTLAKLFLAAFSLTFSVATFAFKLFLIFLGILAGAIFLILQNLVPFLAKHLTRAVPWIISAVVTAGLLIYAAARNIFHGESITEFIEKLIPHKDESSRRKDFSISVIELADSIQADISEKLKAQYKEVVNFFKHPVNVE